jgi:hypothetical protein
MKGKSPPKTKDIKGGLAAMDEPAKAQANIKRLIEETIQSTIREYHQNMTAGNGNGSGGMNYGVPNGFGGPSVSGGAMNGSAGMNYGVPSGFGGPNGNGGAINYVGPGGNVGPGYVGPGGNVGSNGGGANYVERRMAAVPTTVER